jgi:hypothetical protein
MDEKMKVWIKMPKGKEKEAVEVLKKRGGKLPFMLDDDLFAGDVLYIDHEGEIDSVIGRSEMARMLEDYYTEIMIDEPWKDGDVLLCDKFPGQCAVFKKYREDGVFEAYLTIDVGGVSFNATAPVGLYHLASGKEFEDAAKMFYAVARKIFDVSKIIEEK